MRHYLFACILCLCIFLSGPSYAIKHFTISNGLISNTVYNSFRDSKGYIWFATDKGVSRFDGRNFRNYSILDGLTDNVIFNFFEDKRGRLWLYTYNGSSCYIYENRIYNTNNDAIIAEIPIKSFVRSMCTTDDSSIYMGYRPGRVLKLKNGTVKCIINNNNELNENNEWEDLSTVYYNKPHIYVVTRKYIYTLLHDSVVGKREIVNSTGFYCNGYLLLDATNNIEIYKNDSLVWRWKKIVKYYKINKLYIDSKKNIFCCRTDGLYVINFLTGKEKCVFSNNQITSICQDVYGNYWFTSLTDGVFEYNSEFEKINFITDANRGQLIKSYNGQLFKVEGSKVVEFDSRSGQVKSIPFLLHKDETPLSNTDDFFCFNTLVSTSFFDKRSGQLLDLPYYKTCYPYSSERMLLCCIWFIVDLSIRHDEIYNSYKYSLQGKITNCLFDSTGVKFYLLTEKNLYQYDPMTKHLAIIDSFSNKNTPVYMFEFGRSIVVSTNNNYLFCYNKETGLKTGKFELNNILIFDCSRIGKNEYLVYTNNGYYRVQLAANSSVNHLFTKVEYPFGSDEITALYPFGDKIICNTNGILYSFPKNLLNYKLSAPVLFIDKIVINDRKISDTVINLTDALECNINLKLNSLYFNQNTRFKYRILKDGIAGQWFYSNSGDYNIMLPKYGTYTIELKAVTENNIFSPSKFIYIKWVAPFYLTEWFKAVYVVLSIFLLWIILNAINKRRKKVFETELSFLQMENKAINSLLNPHFIFNAINNIQNLVNENQADEANEYLAMLSRLIRQNMENLQFNLITLDKELKLVTNYIHLQNLRFNDNITLEINNKTGATDYYILPLLIHTFVENSVVHGFTDRAHRLEIIIDIKQTGDSLLITLSDNGKGIDKDNINSKEGKMSLGIDMMRKRLKRISDFYHVDYSLTIVNREDKNGVVVHIMMYAQFEKLMKQLSY